MALDEFSKLIPKKFALIISVLPMDSLGKKENPNLVNGKTMKTFKLAVQLMTDIVVQ